ncbi:MAG: hypothetical protein ABIY48_07060, partial [Acidimicrobiales bacterium]
MPPTKPTKATKRAATSGATTAPPRARANVTKKATLTAAAHPATIDLRNEAPHSVALVPVPTPPGPPVELDDPRRSDVDEWGRSEHMREIARRIYDPLYRSWHRVE